MSAQAFSYYICGWGFLRVATVRGQRRWRPADHEREELGVTPTPRRRTDIFQHLDDLKPLPFDQLKPISQAHATGNKWGWFLAARRDGFLIVERRAKPRGRSGKVLLRQLAASRRRPRHAHSASLTELGKKGRLAGGPAGIDLDAAGCGRGDDRAAGPKDGAPDSLGGWSRLRFALGRSKTIHHRSRAVLWQRDLIKLFRRKLRRCHRPSRTNRFRKDSRRRRSDPRLLTRAEK